MGLFRKPDGSVVSVPDDQASDLIAGGYQRVSSTEAAPTAAAETPEDTGLAGQAVAGATSALSGATLGGSDVLLKGFLSKGHGDYLSAAREQHPVTSTLGQIAGTVAGSIAVPGSPAGFLSRAAGDIAASGGLAASLTAGAVEGAVQNAGMYLSDTALGDRDLTAQGMFGAIGTGAEFGIGGTLAVHGIEAGTIAARRMFARVADGGAKAAQVAAQDWAARSQSVMESFDQTAELAQAKLAAARAEREQAGLSRQQAAAGVAEARAGADAWDASQAPLRALDENISKIGTHEDLANLAVKLDEYTAARREFADVHSRVDPDLDAFLSQPITGMGVQIPGEGPVPQGEFGEPGVGGFKSQDQLARMAADIPAESSPTATPSSSEATRVVRKSTISPMSKDEYEAYKKSYANAASEHFPSELHYSKGGDEIVNPELRSGKPLTPEAEKLKNGLDKAFSLPESRLPREATLYRGMSDDPLLGQNGIKDRFKDIKPGDIVEDPAFTSTAYSESAKSRNEQIVFTIRAPAGTPALPIRSQFSGEGELLLPRNTKLMVERVEFVPVSERWNLEGASHEVLPDKSVKVITKSGDSKIFPPIKDIHVSVVGDFAPVGASRAAVSLESPIEKLSVRQLNEYQDMLNKHFDTIQSGTPEYKLASDKWDAVSQRLRDIKDGKIKDVEVEHGAPAPVAAPESTLTGLLRGTLSKMDSGELFGAIGAPARSEFMMAKAGTRAAEAGHFKALAEDAAHPLSIKRLEIAHDDAMDRAVAATDPAERQAAAVEAKAIEQQMTAVGKRPGAVEDVAAMARVITRVEKAAADLTEAVGSSAPAAAQEHASAYRAAEDDASRKTVSRIARAADDASASPPIDRRPGPTGAQRISAARQAKMDADARFARARAAESEAALGAKSARSARDAASAALPPAPPGASIAAPGRLAGVGGKVMAGAQAVEVAHDVGIPGIPSPHDIPVIGPLLSAYLKYRTLRATAGRFMGRVPASAEAHAAALAAKTKDAIATAVDRSLGIVERNIPKVRAATIAASAAVGAALTKRSFDDGGPDAPAGASIPALAAVRMREVAFAATNPHAVTDKVRDSTKSFTDPDLIQAMENHLMAVYQHLNDTAPKGPPPNPYTKKEWQPSPAQAIQWGRRLAVAQDPMTAFDALQSNTLTPEHADTMRVLQDKLFALAQQRFIDRAADLKNPVPYRQLIQNALLFNVPVHPSLQPDNAGILSNAHSPAPPAKNQPTPSTAGPSAISKLYATDGGRTKG